MKRLLILSLFIALITASCTKNIHLNLHDASGLLVIEGNINDQPGPYTVLLSNTVTYYDNNTVVPVSGAHVSITDNAGHYDSLIEVTPGTYHTTGIVGTVGRTYHLSVNSGGKQYDASSTMPSPVPVDSIGALSYNLSGQQRSIAFIMFQDPPGVANYYNSFAYINNQKQHKANPGNDVGIDGQQFQYFVSTDSAFKSPDTVYIELDATDQPIYNYWNSLTSTTLNSQTAAPANPISNISNNALGYFSAYAATHSHRVVVDQFGFHRID